MLGYVMFTVCAWTFFFISAQNMIWSVLSLLKTKKPSNVVFYVRSQKEGMELYPIWNSYNDTARSHQHQLGILCNYSWLSIMFICINVHRNLFCYTGACHATEFHLVVEVSAVGCLESCSTAWRTRCEILVGHFFLLVFVVLFITLGILNAHNWIAFLMLLLKDWRQFEKHYKGFSPVWL